MPVSNYLFVVIINFVRHPTKPNLRQEGGGVVLGSIDVVALEHHGGAVLEHAPPRGRAVVIAALRQRAVL